MWTYTQRWGNLYRDGVLVGTGYAGHGVGMNNPALESAHDIGPLPVGRYRMMEFRVDDPRTGKGTIVLEPISGDMHGRGEFRIHGDNAAMNHTASHGCIIIGNAAWRKRELWDSGDRVLDVVADSPAMTGGVTGNAIG